ncbi:MAG: hypothetical protein JJE34_05760 [Alphaproteobacteria bacterium]|nr:hypothetical protein [Alphaproteobacteria bacterium]
MSWQAVAPDNEINVTRQKAADELVLLLGNRPLTSRPSPDDPVDSE